MKDKSKFKEAMFQYSMLESSVTWWERRLNAILSEMENLPPYHKSLPKKRKQVKFLLRRMQMEEKNIATYFKNNEESD
jgi:predicted  nucleic acid-binding Zn-ribbon protein